MKALMSYVESSIIDMGLDSIMDNPKSFAEFSKDIKMLPPFAEVNFTKLCALEIVKDAYPLIMDNANPNKYEDRPTEIVNEYASAAIALIDSLITVIVHSYTNIQNLLVLYGALQSYMTMLPTIDDNFHETHLSLLKQVEPALED